MTILSGFRCHHVYNCECYCCPVVQCCDLACAIAICCQGFAVAAIGNDKRLERDTHQLPPLLPGMQNCEIAAFKAALAQYTVHPWVGQHCHLVVSTALGWVSQSGNHSVSLVAYAPLQQAKACRS